MLKKFFLSTAIDYVNASPHLGHALEKVQADVVARYHRSLGEEVFFLTGTDENSIKNVKKAEEEGIGVGELVNRNAQKFYQLKDILNLSFDDFIRTTQERHIKGAQKLWLACEKDIYKKRYKGLYCPGCEEFYKERELENGLCPEHKIRPEFIEEENYFFRLSKYKKELEKVIKKEELKIIPESRKNEILSFLERGLEDICISRSQERAKRWGIDVPGDSTQKIWVWLEALSNYINALGYGENGKKFQEFWQENKNKLHIIGKGILRFHALYWPAFLLSAGISLPTKIFVHGYITVEGQKMSKSVGNIIDPFNLVKKYDKDPVRYYLLREISPFEDGDFTYEKFKARYNSDLANGLGNLVARVMNLIEKSKIQGIKIQPPMKNSRLREVIETVEREVKRALDEFRFNEALGSILSLVSFCDRYIEEQQPWRLLSRGQQSDILNLKLKEILTNLASALWSISQLLEPFLPETAEKILRQFQEEKCGQLFPRLK